MTIIRYMREMVQPWLDEIQEATLDLAEPKLREKINEGDKTALIFYLKTKGKQWGYVERTEQTGVNGSAMEIMVQRRHSGL
jgi:hypothetical protein